MKNLSYSEFEKIDLRVGKVISVQRFPEAHRPAYKLKIDFGREIGIKQSSAQITELYSKKKLIGKSVVAVVNLPPKQIGTFISECLVTGFKNKKGDVVLCVPEKAVPQGKRLI